MTVPQPTMLLNWTSLKQHSTLVLMPKLHRIHLYMLKKCTLLRTVSSGKQDFETPHSDPQDVKSRTCSWTKMSSEDFSKSMVTLQLKPYPPATTICVQNNLLMLHSSCKLNCRTNPCFCVLLHQQNFLSYFSILNRKGSKIPWTQEQSSFCQQFHRNIPSPAR